MKKIVAIFLACVLMGSTTLALPGCGNKAETTKTSNSSQDNKTNEKKDPVKLILYISGASTEKDLFDESIADFSKEYPYITVEQTIISGADAFDKIKTAVLAGEKVDIITCGGPLEIQKNGPSLYYPLDEYIKKDNLNLDKEFGSYAAGLTKDGKTYAFPRQLAPAGVWYNKKHFDEAKIPYPTADWTWDEFFDIAKKLTKKDSSGKVERYGAFDWNFAGMYGIAERGLYGGWEILDKDGKPAFEDPRFKKIVGLYYNASMVDKSMPTLADIKAEKMHYMYDMYKGRWSMLISARNTALFFDIHKMNGQLPKEDDEAGIYQLANMPRWDKNSPKKLSADSLAYYSVNKTTKYPEESYKFLKWYVTKCFEVGSKVAHQVPAWRNANISLLSENWRYYKDKDNKVVQGIARTDLYKKVLDPEIQMIAPKNTPNFSYSKQIVDVTTKHLSLLFSGEKNIDTMIKDLSKEANDIYQKEKDKK